MYSLKNTFEQDRGELANQYVNLWQRQDVIDSHDALTEKVLALASQYEGEPHAVIKAKCLSYLLENAPQIKM